MVRLHYIEGRTYEEISTELNIPVNSIGPILARVNRLDIRQTKLSCSMKKRPDALPRRACRSFATASRRLRDLPSR